MTAANPIPVAALAAEDLARFWGNVDTSGECWSWTAGQSSNGYGIYCMPTRLGGRGVRAHRVSYEMHVGPIPDGLVIDHLCRNRTCVNPDHIEPVTQAENIRRGVAYLVSQRGGVCGNGHPITPENTYFRPDRVSGVCRPCKAEQWRRHKGRKSS